MPLLTILRHSVSFRRFHLIVAAGAVLVGCDDRQADYRAPPSSHGTAVSHVDWASQVDAVRNGRSRGIAADLDRLGSSELQNLGQLSRLQSLELPRARCGDEIAAVLEALPELEVLVLGETTIASVGWDAIVGVAKLKRLNLAECAITDADLGKLSHLTELESLRLGSRRLTDGGLSEIAKLTKLRHLILRYAAVTDDGVVALAKLPKLESLYLEGTAVTERGERELLRLRPDLHIHFP